ncbi:LysR substrate-binding domain-containing protein [Streptomyces shenzhenensis]|uniref:LysR substrate-binding domain-containing protein n=1 Tax=Streptomyces shenzhenensis TaxID=943815 RepID=UPI00217ED526|nr:LysR substrate-binding domain-containing protein [Streptomyces shenzhenensis]
MEEASDRAEVELAALLGHLSLRLRIGTFQAAALHLLPPALTTLRHRHPDADVSVIDVVSGRGADEISAGRLDVAIVASWGTPLAPPPHVRAHSLLLDPMVVVLPDDHPLATGQPADTELHLGLADMLIDLLRDVARDITAPPASSAAEACSPLRASSPARAPSSSAKNDWPRKAYCWGGPCGGWAGGWPCCGYPGCGYGCCG